MAPLKIFVETNPQGILVLWPLRACSNCVVESVSPLTKDSIRYVGGVDMEFLARIEIVRSAVASLITPFQMQSESVVFHPHR